MPKIAHIADVHWRGLSRHEEYTESFAAFFENLRQLKPDLIYVGGDIFHSKTQGISPELIDRLVWWFREMGDIAPTHVILGNHDGIMLNKDRQDAITPIIEAIKHDNIFLYKKSGTYPTGIKGFSWCVFSCFDEEGWEDVKPSPGDVNIALYHGGVWGSKTDIDWDIEGEISVEFFKDYDFALLGDIHKAQFLTEDKRIAYCGSSIQQNYGESPGKGFLFWDIESRDSFDVKFFEIPHSRPFITVDWSENVADTLSVAKASPKGSRFRIRSKELIPQVELRQIKNELNLIMEASEVVFKDDYVPDTSKISLEENSLEKADLRDPDTHVNLLRDYLSDVQLEDADWAMIEEIVQSYVKNIVKDDLSAKSRKWSVNRVGFSNTFGYGENNLINFDSLPGITGIFGKNAKGKSSIIGTMTYGLFNTTDRGAIKNVHVINTRKDYCGVTVDLTTGKEKLRIERQSVRKKDRSGRESAVTHLNLWRLDEQGNQIADLSGEQRIQTEKIIRGIIGNADDFLITSLASQGEMNTFIKDRATARKSYLTKFLGLDIFDKLQELIKSEMSTIKGQVKSAPDRDWNSLIQKLREEKKQIESESTKIEAELESLRYELQGQKIRLSEHSNSDVVTTSDIQSQEEIIAKQEKEILSIEQEIIGVKSEEEKLSSKIQKIKEVLSAIDVEQIREKLSAAIESENELRDLQHALDKAKTKHDQQIESADILKKVPCGEKFSSCMFIKNSHRDKVELETQKKLIKVLQDQIETIANLLIVNKKEDLKKRLEQCTALSKKESTLRVSLSKKQIETHSLQTRLENASGQLAREVDILKDLSSKVVDSESSLELDAIKNQIMNLSSEIATLDAKRIQIANRSGRIDGEVDNYKAERKKYQKIRQKWKIYQLISQATSKRGIPLQIIKSQLPVINVELSKILSDVASFTIELHAEDDSNAMNVFIDYGDSKRIIEVASGMEKMIASLAIRVALINISSLPKSDMLIIDEGFGALDDINVEACNRMLVSLKKWFRTILIITHVDGVKDVADNIIDISRNGKDASVVYE